MAITVPSRQLGPPYEHFLPPDTTPRRPRPRVGSFHERSVLLFLWGCMPIPARSRASVQADARVLPRRPVRGSAGHSRKVSVVVSLGADADSGTSQRRCRRMLGCCRGGPVRGSAGLKVSVVVSREWTPIPPRVERRCRRMLGCCRGGPVEGRRVIPRKVGVVVSLGVDADSATESSVGAGGCSGAAGEAEALALSDVEICTGAVIDLWTISRFWEPISTSLCSSFSAMKGLIRRRFVLR